VALFFVPFFFAKKKERNGDAIKSTNKAACSIGDSVKSIANVASCHR
jgi:hypothetical protein